MSYDEDDCGSQAFELNGKRFDDCSADELHKAACYTEAWVATGEVMSEPHKARLKALWAAYGERVDPRTTRES